MDLKRNLLFILLFLSLPVLGQEKPFSAPTVYVEVLGSGISWYTVNVEKVVFKTGRRFGAAHIGFGAHRKPYTRSENGNYTKWALPIGLSLFKGSGNHHGEFGVSLTYISGFEDNSATTAFELGLKKSESLFLIPNFGYRFHRSQGGFFLRFQITPVIKLKEFSGDPNLKQRSQRMLGAGLSLGYTFHRKTTSP